MSADFGLLRKAFRARLRAIPDFPGDKKVQWENIALTPPSDGSLWLRENLVAGSERLTSTRFVECLGLYYIYVNGPAGRGTQEVHDLAKQIVDAFPPGTSIPDLGAHLYRTERLAARLDGPRADGTADPTWFSVPVIVYWRLHAAVAQEA